MGIGNYEELATAARRTVAPEVVDYCIGGAGDERTVARNVAMLDRLAFIPRVLNHAGTPELSVSVSVEVTGGMISAPLLVAPMGLQGMYHIAAEVETAAAAAGAGVGFCLSTFSSADAEEVVTRAGKGLRWRQVYLLRDPDITRYLVRQAEELGFAAIVCTVDVPVVGKRGRDRANGFKRFSVAPPALVKTSVFQQLNERRGEDPQDTLDDIFPNPTVTWDDIEALVSSTSLPVLIKGILHPDDARRAWNAGASGIIVSNHGGRQLACSVASIEMLPAVRAAVQDAIPVYLDSGIRTGEHIALALALGARAVLVGRPLLLALAAGGRDLVAAVLGELVCDLQRTMMLVGAKCPADLQGIDVIGFDSFPGEAGTR
jgi:isopentenyl diphosphate isomerase/L-lactate dehydrogenase-like FMN-dependent dehydrogenase